MLSGWRRFRSAECIAGLNSPPGPWVGIEAFHGHKYTARDRVAVFACGLAEKKG
ncbi:hypothetical protein MULP_00885 [Mycobacterium liflandii 128FXT]|uniref:Uncharacterized protein n=2 Tax=Mycobacterium ulcerans group TaxID=2993898 RepID=A0A3E2MTR3_MYCMR|nr:hypothetical protein MULP_00885 [Mycobacterium liflandii 128FXT]EPQ49425.1 hypothetical protein MMSP_5186 [Mycobacterium sp. 012931]EPQ70045.1 hypothetical protein MMEU_4484 [Mycobacterium marinum str. Europe]EPQ73806.1 hypothetical protein MMMB2_4578 [Mycobacterium marinum MB2]MBC9861572.1 hypothetical protein [Mycobacterium pseudoshottsii]RFZ38700.1 hypothetical protein DAVIS_03534 [Mycobacterium marinum]